MILVQLASFSFSPAAHLVQLFNFVDNRRLRETDTRVVSVEYGVESAHGTVSDQKQFLWLGWCAIDGWTADGGVHCLAINGFLHELGRSLPVARWHLDTVVVLSQNDGE